ncbi:hypothetical protein Tco_0670447 [Tanacetum coccineum]
MFLDPKYPEKVYKVVKALYGLHQAPRACLESNVDDIIFWVYKEDLGFKVLQRPLFKVLSAVKRIFRYLKGKPKLGLWYPRVSSFDLESYSDSDYAGANLDRKSTTGEAEYVAAASCKELSVVSKSKEDCFELFGLGYQFKNSLVKHFEDMRLCRPSKEYLPVWFDPPRDESMSC